MLGLSGCGAKEEPDDTTPKPYTCSGTPATCLRLGSGWTYEGVILSMSQTGNGGSDPVVIRLDDGRTRIYYAVADTPNDPDWWGMVSWISDDGLNFTKEAGYRFEGYTLFGHWIVRNPDGSFRMYWLDQKQGQVNAMGYKAIKSALSTDGGWTFIGGAGREADLFGHGIRDERDRSRPGPFPRRRPIPDVLWRNERLRPGFERRIDRRPELYPGRRRPARQALPRGRRCSGA